MFKAYREDLAIYITNNAGLFTEVFFLSFPRFTGASCCYSTLTEDCRQRLDRALAAATVVADRFTADGRNSATVQELQKAFNREIESNVN